jgi:hypothetical protein
VNRELNAKVREMLEAGDKPIKAVAEECGTYYAYVYGVMKSMGADKIPSGKRRPFGSAFLMACGLGFCTKCMSTYKLTSRNRHICNPCRAKATAEYRYKRDKAQYKDMVENGYMICHNCWRLKSLDRFSRSGIGGSYLPVAKVCRSCNKNCTSVTREGKQAKKTARDRLRKFVFSGRGDTSLFGCSHSEMIQHIESQFEDGMAWDNHGQYGWHLDHIKPLSLFDLSNEAQAKEAMHYTNVQPLWWRDNIIKGGVRN